MKIVVQRVTQASVTIDGKVKGKIKDGFMILAGFVDDDTDQDLEWIAGKIVGLRVFNDQQGVMNLSIQDTGGDILLISQFTLHALVSSWKSVSYLPCW